MEFITRKFNKRPPGWDVIIKAHGQYWISETSFDTEEDAVQWIESLPDDRFPASSDPGSDKSGTWLHTTRGMAPSLDSLFNMLDEKADGPKQPSRLELDALF